MTAALTMMTGAGPDATARPAHAIPALTHSEAALLAQTEYTRLLTVLEALDGDDWRQPTYCAAWTVRDMVAHLAGACAGWASWAEFRRQMIQNPYLNETGQQVDGINKRQILDRADRTPAELMAEFRAVAPKATRTRQRLPALLRNLRLPLGPPLGTAPLHYLTDNIYTRDQWMHRYDLCAATGKEMVAHAMFALECEMVPGELHEEGPFAEVTGYYATVAPRPLVRVKRIHRRRKPVFHTILSGVEVFNSVGLLGEANVLALLQKQVPGVKDVYFSHGGCGFYHAVVQIAQKRAGWAKQALMAAFAAFPPLKMVTVVDDDVDIRDPGDVEWAMATRLDPKHGILTIENVFGHGLNPSFPNYLGSKVGFDATRPFPHTPNYERAKLKNTTLDGLDLVIPDLLME